MAFPNYHFQSIHYMKTVNWVFMDIHAEATQCDRDVDKLLFAITGEADRYDNLIFV
jgi:hypothetical protein